MFLLLIWAQKWVLNERSHFFQEQTFEFTLVGSIPIMTEILPGARATMMAIYIAGMSLGRAAGASLALSLYHWGQSMTFLPVLLVSALATVGFNLLALLFLIRIHKATQ